MKSCHINLVGFFAGCLFLRTFHLGKVKQIYLNKEVLIVEIIGMLVFASYTAVIIYFFMLMSSMEKSLKRIADRIDKKDDSQSGTL